MSFSLSTEEVHEAWLLKFLQTIQTEEKGKQHTGHTVKIRVLYSSIPNSTEEFYRQKTL